MKILVINGPNLNLLGQRDHKKYGSLTLQQLEQLIRDEFPHNSFDFYQTNIEGEIVDKIQKCCLEYEGLIINPGGYSHTSVAIRDALEICSIVKIEVHLSNLAEREDFRKNSITAARCNGYISGLKEHGYLAAVYTIQKMLISSGC